MKLFKQYQATVHYWNYLVQVQSLPFDVYANGHSLGVKVGYRCLGCGPFSDVVISMKSVLLAGVAPSKSKWSLGGLNLKPTTMGVAVFVDDTADGDPVPPPDPTQSAVLTIDSIDKNEYAVATMALTNTPYYTPAGDPVKLELSYRVTASWFDTHLSVPITRFKDIYVETPPSS